MAHPISMRYEIRSVGCDQAAVNGRNGRLSPAGNLFWNYQLSSGRIF